MFGLSGITYIGAWTGKTACSYKLDFNEVTNMVGIIKEHSKGFFKDGRKFEIIDFKNFAFSDDGTIHSGTVGVAIDGVYDTYCVSDIAKMIDYEKYNHN